MSVQVDNLVSRKVWKWGADQSVEFTYDPVDGALPDDIASWTMSVAVGPDDGTESEFTPALTATIDDAGKVVVPITNAQSIQVPATASKLRMGCWGVDTSGRKYDIFDIFLPVVRTKGRP